MNHQSPEKTNQRKLWSHPRAEVMWRRWELVGGQQCIQDLFALSLPLCLLSLLCSSFSSFLSSISCLVGVFTSWTSFQFNIFCLVISTDMQMISKFMAEVCGSIILNVPHIASEIIFVRPLLTIQNQYFQSQLHYSSPFFTSYFYIPCLN